MADRSRAARLVCHLLVLSLFVSSVVGFSPRFGERKPPFRPTLHPPINPPQYHRRPQQQSNNGVNTNNVSPYYDEDWEAENENRFASDQNGRPEYVEHNLYGDSRPGGPLRGNEQGFSTDTPTWRTRVQPTPKEPECGVVARYKGSVPRGNPKELHVTRLESESAKECLKKCCELGPKDCPFIWVFGEKCMAVACPPETPELCEPRSIDDKRVKGETGYYRITHPLVHNIKSEFEDEAKSTAGTPSDDDDDVVVTSPTDATGDDTVVVPTEGGAPTHQSGMGKGRPTQFDLNGDKTDHEDTTTDHEETTPGEEETTADHDETTETTTGREDTTTGREDTTVEHSSDLNSSKPPSTVSTETTFTPPTLAEPPEHLENLAVAVSGSTEVFLPENRVQLFATTWPDLAAVKYHWSRVFGQREGVLSGMNDAAVTLSELLPGVYGLRVTAEAPNGQSGEKFVNVTVHEKPRKNTSPHPVISPSTNYTVTLPQSTVIFDASQSQDDMGPENLGFLWQQVAGPMETAGESHEALLKLSNPEPGQYKYKLTITDSDGAVNVSYVDLKVVPERDYPPLANAGSDLILKLPNSEVVLNGNRSTDDKPGLKYLWKILSEQSSVDMEGTDGPYLRVSKLSVGVYLFKLTVTDSAGQTDSSEVTVDVLSEKNEPPVAEAGGPYTVHYPETKTTLDGSHSHDDYEKGMKFSWILTSGPRDIVLKGKNTSHLSVSGLHIDPAQGSPTIFTFNLTITDYANLSTTDTAQLEYRKDPKVLPHVSAGPDLTITLPQNTVVLNGSATWDDFGITSYQWSRSDKSPAAGIPLLDSDTKPVLILSDLVNGTYNFILHVTNSQGVSASDTIVLHVLGNPHDRHIILLHLDTDISNFTRADLKDLGKYLSLTLDDYTIQFQGVYEEHPHTVVEFYAIDERTHTFMNVSEAWRKLTENGQDYHVLHYHVVHVEMKECQLSCSGHGKCDQRTKRCHCDAFWTENPFTANTGRQESNCEWSVFYVVLLVIGVLFIMGITFWLTCWCCFRRRKLARSKRRIRYAIHDHNEEGESKRMLTKEHLGYQESSLMQSESETEEEVLFESGKKRRSSSPQVKNNKLNSEKYGKNSSLVNTVIPK